MAKSLDKDLEHEEKLRRRSYRIVGNEGINILLGCKCGYIARRLQGEKGSTLHCDSCGDKYEVELALKVKRIA